MLQASSPPWTSVGPERDSEPSENRSIVVCIFGASTTRASTLDVIDNVTNDYGARPIYVNDLAAVEELRFSSGLRLALISVEASLADDCSILKTIEQLREMSFKIICYGDRFDQFPLGQKCRLLLSGAIALFDSAGLQFRDELSHLFSHLFTLEADRQREETTLKLKMNQLGLVGESHAMISVFQWLQRVSPLSDIPVLITGETGTGKDLLVKALWQLDAKRCNGPFVTLNCSAISPWLVESELFGHKKGAFTGAERDRKGLFRFANEGVLFLDEIGDLDLLLQAKLLRVLQEGRVLGVGEDREVPVATRVIAATNRNLKEMVQQGKFRADLFHRLDILSIHVPPIRRRPEDVRPLIEHFLRKYRSLVKHSTLLVHSEVVEALSQVELPGNARQIENIVRQVLVNKDSSEPLRLSDLAPEIWRSLSGQPSEPTLQTAEDNRPPDDSANGKIDSNLSRLIDRYQWGLSESVEYCERLLLASALKNTTARQSETAKRLRITPRTLYSKIRKYNLHHSNDK
ncbi:MAG TPA: sigma 54-interacting transcriptional regulator [Pyrinomonadaceae bacterium]|nr:sigma 54-interacting transcriptional regulator [Pyrinomonadaceae bacterium]